MISEKGSATAVGAAIWRAAHQLIDGENKLLQDDIILQLLDPGIKNYILQNSHHFMEAEAIACLGVLVYLGKSAVDRLFKWIGSLAAGTSFVFTISRKQSMVQLSRAATLAASAGEPWITHFEPGELETALHACGFREISFLTPVLAEQLYFAKKEIRLPVPRKSSIVLASV